MSDFAVPLGNDIASRLARLSIALGRVAEMFGKWGSFLILPLVFFTMWDVFARKLIWIQIFLVENVSRLFESTLLQELEWHFHTGLFALVLGYGYVYNRHVRVDLVRERLPLKGQAWIEFIGCTFFMIPYCAVVIYFAFTFAHESFLNNEISASLVGLSHRWIIKTVLLVGLIVALTAGLAVWLQTVLVLFGPKDLRFDLMTLDWDDSEKDARRIKLEEEEAAAAATTAERESGPG